MKGYQFKRKTSLEERKEIINWYLEGYSITIIAKHYKIDHTTIYHYLKDVENYKEKRKPAKPHETQLGKQHPDGFIEPIPKPQMSKELVEEMKLYPKRKIYGKLTPKGLTYEDYQRIENAKKK